MIRKEIYNMRTISKRWVKNAVAIIIMLALCGSMFFTMSYAKSRAQASAATQMSQSSDASGGPGGGGTPPDQSSSGSSDSSQSKDQQNSQPPAKPEDSGSSSRSGQSQDSSQSQNNDQSGQNEQPGNNSGVPQGAPEQISDLSTLYYILFGAESFLLALALTEILITRGNRRTLKQSLYNRDKAIIFALTVILVTAGGTFLCSKITTDFVLADSNGRAPGQSSGQTASYSAVKELTEDTTKKAAAILPKPPMKTSYSPPVISKPFFPV